MAILINDMQMPTKCYNCVFCQIEEHGWGRYLYLCLAKSKSRDSMRIIDSDPFTKPEWCPLVDVGDK